MTMNKLILTTLATAFVANAALAQSLTFNNDVMADNGGRTLYTFDKDTANKSNCYGGCAAAWPPFIAKDGDRASAGFTLITRDDGTKQWAMSGKPLYYFLADSQAGDIKGDGNGGVWHVIRSAGNRTQAQPTASRPSTGGYGTSGSYSGY
jgi:predicted lipoprotein with Yx(FWY)xxD motif